MVITTEAKTPGIHQLGSHSLRLDQIRHNPYQPSGRIDVPDEVARKYGESILQHGLIQTPVVRFVCAEGVPPGAIDGGHYEMGDGWMRLSGYRWLKGQGHPGFDEIPVNVCHLSDQQMADLVIEANMVRRDLNPIEQAELFSRYTKDFGISQSQLAKEHGITQGEVSNTIRLLELPADIQKMVSSGEISQTHARQLLRLKDEPGIQKSFAERLPKTKESVESLSNGIASGIYNRSKPLDSKEYPAPIFDVVVCEVCDKREKIGRPYSNAVKEWRCRNPKCWDEKQAAAETARTEALKSAGGDDKTYTAEKLGYSNFQHLHTWDLSRIDNPDECLSCPRRVNLKESNGVQLVCVDLKCFRNKTAIKTKADKAAANAAETKLTEDIKAIIKQDDFDSNSLVAVVLYLFDRICSKETIKLASGMLGAEIPGHKDLAGIEQFVKPIIGTSKVDELLLALALADRRGTAENTDSWKLRRLMAAAEGSLDKFNTRMARWKAANCPGCSNASYSKSDNPSNPDCYQVKPCDFENAVCKHRRGPVVISQEIPAAEAVAP